MTEKAGAEPPNAEVRHAGDARARIRRLAGWAKRAAVPMGLVLAFLVGWWVARPEAEPAPSGSEGHEHGDEETIWTCSMHPQIRLPEPGKCPICGMDLIPVESAGPEAAASPNRIVLSERARAAAEVRTVPVRRADTAVELRLLGRLEHAETRVRTITPWTGGRIDRLYVSTVGARIGPGSVIGLFYSPEIYTAHQDLIQARRQLDRLKGGLPVARDAARSALESARKRLELLGLKKKEIGEMEKEKSPRRHVKIRSPYGGTVLEQLVNEGAYVSAGTPLYRTADLSTLWVQLDAYESDLSRIEKGQKVTLTVSSYPGETFEGKVAFIDPVVDPRNRTAQVRVEVPNKEGKLSPGMFAEAVIHARAAAKGSGRLVIPDTAPLFTGKRSVVYVEVPNADRPVYEVREVQLGPRAGDVYPVASGLQEGDRVVVQGAFALDSELQIRGGHSMMTMSDDEARAARSPIAVSPEFLVGLAPVVEAYLELQERLRSDQLEPAQKAFGALAKRAQAFDPRSPDETRKAWQSLSKRIFAAAIDGSKAGDLEALRRAFHKVTDPMLELVERFGNPTSEPVRLAFCPMVFGNQGAHWLQSAKQIENPYFGADMYRCGEIKQVIEHGGRLSGARPSSKAGAAAAAHAH